MILLTETPSYGVILNLTAVTEGAAYKNLTTTAGLGTIEDCEYIYLTQHFSFVLVCSYTQVLRLKTDKSSCNTYMFGP